MPSLPPCRERVPPESPRSTSDRRSEVLRRDSHLQLGGTTAAKSFLQACQAASFIALDPVGDGTATEICCASPVERLTALLGEDVFLVPSRCQFSRPA